MIILKKFCKLLTAALSLSIFLSGCVSSPQNSSSEVSADSEASDVENTENSETTEAEEESEPVSENEETPEDSAEKSEDTEDSAEKSEDTEKTDNSAPQTIKAESGKYVYDYADILSDDEENQLTEYIKNISSEKMINAAVVTISSSGDSTSADYAKDIFSQLYDNAGNGLVFVLNNDTKYDYLLKTGVCDKMIDTNALNAALFSATELFVKGEYKNGIMEMMNLSESCPSHIFDEIGVYSVEELQFIENRLANGNKDISVILTANTSATNDYDLCKIWHDRRYPDGSGYMILLNTALQQSAVYTNAEITGNLAAAFATASEYLYQKEYYLAMDAIINYIDY